MEQPPPASEGSASDGLVVVPPSPKAVRYYRSGNVIWAVEQVLGLALPGAAPVHGAVGAHADVRVGVARGHFYPTLVVYLALLSRCCCSSCSCR